MSRDGLDLDPAANGEWKVTGRCPECGGTGRPREPKKGAVMAETYVIGPGIEAAMRQYADEPKGDEVYRSRNSTRRRPAGTACTSTARPSNQVYVGPKAEADAPAPPVRMLSAIDVSIEQRARHRAADRPLQPRRGGDKGVPEHRAGGDGLPLHGGPGPHRQGPRQGRGVLRLAVREYRRRAPDGERPQERRAGGRGWRTAVRGPGDVHGRLIPEPSGVLAGAGRAAELHAHPGQLHGLVVDRRPLPRAGRRSTAPTGATPGPGSASSTATPPWRARSCPGATRPTSWAASSIAAARGLCPRSARTLWV
jgi:hypothetical protein